MQPAFLLKPGSWPPLCGYHVVGAVRVLAPRLSLWGPYVGLSLADSVAAPQPSQGHGALLTGSQHQCQVTHPQLNASLSPDLFPVKMSQVTSFLVMRYLENPCPLSF